MDRKERWQAVAAVVAIGAFVAVVLYGFYLDGESDRRVTHFTDTCLSNGGVVREGWQVVVCDTNGVITKVQR